MKTKSIFSIKRFVRNVPGKLAFTRVKPRAWVNAGLIMLFGVSLMACSPHIELYPKLDSLAQKGEYEKAAALVEKNKGEYGKRNALLWYLDRGAYYHYAGQYDKSNKSFAEAERIIDELFTESVTRNVGAFLSNDNTLPYRGEDFEAVIINVYRALNYAGLGDVESALVEARKVDSKLGVINRQYKSGKKNRYREDAFARMLMGIFYEAGGSRSDMNDAYISNKLSAETYQKDFSKNYKVGAPGVLKENLLSTAGFMGPDEVAETKKRFAGVKAPTLAEKQKMGAVYLVHFAGAAPVKYEDAIRAFNTDGTPLKIAFPKYRRRSYQITASRMVLDGQAKNRLEVAQPTGDIAMKSLADRKGRIAAKAIARAIVKYNLMKKEKSGGGQALLSIYNFVTEKADLRAWQTLPDKILLGRVLLPPGSHKLDVDYLSSAGKVVAKQSLGKFDIQAGQTRFFVVHTNR